MSVLDDHQEAYPKSAQQIYEPGREPTLTESVTTAEGIAHGFSTENMSVIDAITSRTDRPDLISNCLELRAETRAGGNLKGLSNQEYNNIISGVDLPPDAHSPDRNALKIMGAEFSEYTPTPAIDSRYGDSHDTELHHGDDHEDRRATKPDAADSESTENETPEKDTPEKKDSKPEDDLLQDEPDLATPLTTAPAADPIDPLPESDGGADTNTASPDSATPNVATTNKATSTAAPRVYHTFDM